MEDILKRYLRQCDEDKANENNELPASPIGNDINKNKELKEAYEAELKKTRHEIDPDTYMRKMKEITYSENDFLKMDAISVSDIDTVKVVRAYCPKCGRELRSEFPAMFNPFTKEKQCIHECECGEKYNLEYVYPRLAFFVNGEEIKAFGL